MAGFLFRNLCGRFRQSARIDRRLSPGPRCDFVRYVNGTGGHKPRVSAQTDVSAAKKPSIRVTLVEGDGPGPAVCAAVRKILKAAKVPIEWDRQTVRVRRDPITDRMAVNAELLQSAADTRVVLRGPATAPADDGSPVSTALTLHKALRASIGVQLFASVEGHCPFGYLSMVNVRDNVSAEYSEIEHLVTPGVVQSIKTVTRRQSEELARFAFDYAVAHGHRRVTTLHKANVMRMSDGTFLKACRRVKCDYPGLEYNEERLDKFCLQVVNEPCQYDVLLTPSLYGAIAGAAVSAMAGGPATVPYAAFGPDVAVFGTMYDGPAVCRNGVIAKPVINPTGLIRSATWMLQHLGMPEIRLRIEKALDETIRQGVKTGDMDGAASCEQFTNAIVKNVARQER